jgi:hypothetical protein
MDYTDCNDFLWPIEIFGIKIFLMAERIRMQEYDRISSASNTPSFFYYILPINSFLIII